MNLKDNKNNKTTKNTPMTVPYTPGNVREFDSCHGNVGHFTKSRGIVGKNLVGEKLPKTVYCELHIYIHTGI